MSDAQEEYDIREKMYKEEKHKKNEAASAAASWRAQEKGAAAVAKGLSIGAALKAGMLAAKAAEKKYRENAEEQEKISRKAKVAEEAAYELMQQVMALQRPPFSDPSVSFSRLLSDWMISI